jgi:hypothetical protein
LHKVVDHAGVKVLTTQVSVTSGGLDFEDTVFNGQEGHIESTTSEIEDENVALTGGLLVQTISDGGGGRLVDDTLDGETSDGSGVLGGLTLAVVEVGGDGDDGRLDGGAQVGLSDLLHLLEDHGGDLLRGEDLGLTHVLNLNVGLVAVLLDDLEGPVLGVVLDHGVGELAADQTLGVEDGVGGVHGDLVLGSITDQTLRVSETDIRGGGAVSLIVGDDLHAIVLPDTNAGVGSSEIDLGRHR